jgi:hypothetical protein
MRLINLPSPSCTKEVPICLTYISVFWSRMLSPLVACTLHPLLIPAIYQDCLRLMVRSFRPFYQDCVSSLRGIANCKESDLEFNRLLHLSWLRIEKLEFRPATSSQLSRASKRRQPGCGHQLLRLQKVVMATVNVIYPDIEALPGSAVAGK